MTKQEKIKILERSKEERRSEVHEYLRRMDKIQGDIKRTEFYIESLERSIEKLKTEVAEELPENVV